MHREHSPQDSNPTPTPKRQVRMVAIPGGTFLMGGGSKTKEGASYEVVLSPYWIDVTEVTIEEYMRCVDAGQCSEPSVPDTQCVKLSSGKNRPANCVSWQNAVDYCTWVGKRLPTEAEWEFAATGGENRRFPWGKAAPDDSRVHWSGNCGYVACGGAPIAVGERPSGDSPFGVADMAGNVSEWVLDWHGDYPTQRKTNPRGPEGGKRRVIRGGSWDTSTEDSISTTARSRAWPQIQVAAIGFRCASSEAPEFLNDPQISDPP